MFTLRGLRLALAAMVCVCALTLTGCHSHKVVMRGDQGSAVDYGKGSPKSKNDTKPPKVTTKDKALRALLEEAYSWLGTPYKYGGQAKDGADCSGFVMMSYVNALGIKLPRTSYDQGEYCKRISKDKLQAGDLVFFRTGKADRVSHVGIYIGDDKIIHASSSRGVVIDNLSGKYYVDHYHHSGYIPAFRSLRKK